MPKKLALLGMSSLVLLQSACEDRTPRYQSEAERVCANLHRIANQSAPAAWAEGEIRLTMNYGDNTPRSLDPGELPGWAKTLFGNSAPKASIHPNVTYEQSYLQLAWVHGRGAVGVILCSTNTSHPPLDARTYFIMKCQPGVFVFAPKEFP